MSVLSNQSQYRPLIHGDGNDNDEEKNVSNESTGRTIFPDVTPVKDDTSTKKNTNINRPKNRNSRNFSSPFHTNVFHHRNDEEDNNNTTGAMNARLLNLLQIAMSQSEAQIKKLSLSSNPILKAWEDGTLQAFTAWIVWLVVGSTFYAEVNFDGNYSKGFYYAVNVGYSIGWGVLHDHSTLCKAFSILYILVGAIFVSRWLSYLLEAAIAEKEANAYDLYLLEQRLRKKNPFARSSPFLSDVYVYVALNSTRLVIIYLWLVYVFIGMIWSCAVIQWSVIDGFYFSVSSLSTGGLWGIPANSPDSEFVLVGVFAALGVPLMGMSMANLAALILDRRVKNQAEIFGKFDVSQRGKLLLDIFRHDKDRAYLDKNEFVIFNLMKRKKIDLALINEIYEEFDTLDTHGTGILTYSSLLQRASEQPSSLQVELDNTVEEGKKQQSSPRSRGKGINANKYRESRGTEVINQLHLQQENDIIR